MPEGPSHTVDYLLHLGDVPLAVEIEALEEMRGWNPRGVHTRTVGEHLRRKIADARKQVQAASKAGHPTLLLIHNAVDPFQAFGTEPHDFLAAMYGDYTVRIAEGRIVNRYRDRNAKLQRGRNTSFSGVGHLSATQNGARIHVYENFFARIPLPFAVLPEAIGVSRIEVELAANKQLQRTVTRRRGRAARAPFHYARASRWTALRAAAELRRCAQAIPSFRQREGPR